MTDTITKARDGKVDWELVQAASKAASQARKTKAATPQTIDQESGAEDVRLTARKTCERFGKSTRTLNRWLDDPDLGFPRPMRIKGRRYFSLAELKKWERRRTIGKAV
jgi:hypothetical protein